MNAVAHEQRFTLADIEAMLAAPLRDQRFLLTRLGGAVVDYLAWKETEDRAAARTLDQYERDLARLCIELAAHAPYEVVRADMRRVIATFPEGSRPRATAVYKDFFGWLYAESDEPGFRWAITRDPMAGIRNRRRQPRVVYDIFSDEDEARLITRGPCRDYGRAIEVRDRVIILALLRAGLRAEGIRHLQVSSVDLIEKWLIVEREKGGDGRVVPIAGPLVRALEEFMLTEVTRVRTAIGGRVELVNRPPIESDYILYPNGASARGLLWTDPSRPRVYSSFWRWWQGCVRRAGVRYRKPHMNRHTFATKLRRSGADITDVQKALGHRSINSTLIYTHVDVRDVARSIERMEKEREQV